LAEVLSSAKAQSENAARVVKAMTAAAARRARSWSGLAIVNIEILHVKIQGRVSLIKVE
jgi:hypothetical protein